MRHNATGEDEDDEVQEVREEYKWLPTLTNLSSNNDKYLLLIGKKQLNKIYI